MDDMPALLIEAIEVFRCENVECDLAAIITERSASYHFHRKAHHQKQANARYKKWKRANALAAKHRAAGNHAKAEHYAKQAEKHNRAVGRHIHMGYHHETKWQQKRSKRR